MKKLTAVIQARLNSKRLNEKVMLPILGKPMIFYIIERLKELKGINQIILATSDPKINSKLIKYVKKNGLGVFSHSNEDDICARLYKTCEFFDSDAILKINADCPILELNILNRMIKLYEENQYIDCITNKKKFSWPMGFSAEILSKRSLEWCYNNLENPKDREFVASFITKNEKKKFKLISIESKINHSHLNLMVDTSNDFKKIKIIFEKLYHKKKFFNFRDVVNFIKKES